MTDMSLPEMLRVVHLIEDKVASQGGELSEADESAITAVEQSISTKADAYAFVLDNLESRIDYWKDQAKKRSMIAATLTKLHERIRGRIKDVMIANSMNEILGDEIKFHICNSQPRLVIDNPNALPKEFWIITSVPDNDRIRTALKTGTVPGAHFEPVKALRTTLIAKK